MADISVARTAANEAGWTFKVTVDDGQGKAEFTVSLSRKDHERFSGAPDKVAPEKLVEESFAFLLEREPKGSILRSFAIPDIIRYFPEYPKEIPRRLSSRSG
jgi:hypothetical protein